MTELPESLEDVQAVFEEMLADEQAGHPEFDPDVCAEDARVQTVHFHEAWQRVQERQARDHE